MEDLKCNVYTIFIIYKFRYSICIFFRSHIIKLEFFHLLTKLLEFLNNFLFVLKTIPTEPKNLVFTPTSVIVCCNIHFVLYPLPVLPYVFSVHNAPKSAQLTLFKKNILLSIVLWNGLHNAQIMLQQRKLAQRYLCRISKQAQTDRDTFTKQSS